MLLPLQFIPGIKGILDEEEIEVKLKSYNVKCGDPDCHCPAFGAILFASGNLDPDVFGVST